MSISAAAFLPLFHRFAGTAFASPLVAATVPTPAAPAATVAIALSFAPPPPAFNNVESLVQATKPPAPTARPTTHGLAPDAGVGVGDAML